MAAVRAAAPTDGTAPNAEQQAAMAAAVASSGMDIAAFNALATAVSTDRSAAGASRRARHAGPAAGSVAASVTDAEAAQFGAAMVAVRAAGPPAAPPRPPNSRPPWPQRSRRSGLALERFNAIAQAVSGDERSAGPSRACGPKAQAE